MTTTTTTTTARAAHTFCAGCRAPDPYDCARAFFGEEGPPHAACSCRCHTRADVLPTGSASLDKALGIGGLPLGRVSELQVQGDLDPSRLVCALLTAALAQDDVLDPTDTGASRGVLYVDGSGGIAPPPWGESDHPLAQRVLVAAPPNLERLAGVIEDGCRAALRLVVAMLPEVPVPENIEDAHQARRDHETIAIALRRITAAASRTGTAVVLVTRGTPPARFGWPSETAPSALRFYCSVRVELRSDFARVVKNKHAPPFVTAENWQEGLPG